MLLRLTAEWVTAIKHFECVGGQPNLIAYLCGALKWTYGFGRTRGVTEGMTCTPHEAELMLQEDIEESLMAIARLFPGREFNENEIGSMVSFIHNFGEDKFKSYSLFKLIRDEAPEAEIKAQWLKYQYTIVDQDADGDLDAVIDRGLPIRRYRELLMRDGFSFAIASAAANENTLDLREDQVPWRNGGFKERLVSRTPYEEVLRRAVSLEEFEADDAIDWEEVDEDVSPDPTDIDDEIFEELDTGRGGDMKTPELTLEERDPTKDTPLTAEDLNYIQYVDLGGKKPWREFSMSPEKLKQVKPHYSPDTPEKAGSVKMEQTSRFKGAHHRQAGIDMQQAAAGATIAATGLAGVDTAVEHTESITASPIIGWLMLGLIFFAAVWFGVGWFRRWYGVNKQYKGEAGASQYMH